MFEYVTQRLLLIDKISNTHTQSTEEPVMEEQSTEEQPPEEHALHTIFLWWLWVPDANEEVVRHTFTYNQVHLTGLYLAHRMSYEWKPDERKPGEEILCSGLLLDALHREYGCLENTLFFPHAETMYSELSLRQLRDVVESLQWQWSAILDTILQSGGKSGPVITVHMDALFRKLGVFLHTAQPAEVFDDLSFVESSALNPTLLIICETGVKMFVNLFYILYRALYVTRSSTRIDEKDAETCRVLHAMYIENFHVEASLDEFYNVGMYYDLAPGCLLDYRHGFKGFYNSVSQVVYRHYPDYKRRVQDSCQQIQEGILLQGHDVNVLPCLRQMYPEIEYSFEDHHFGCVLTNRGKKGPLNTKSLTWNWLCIAARFYLVNSQGDCFSATNVATLLAFYIKSTA
jgi:hypothetical protein